MALSSAQGREKYVSHSGCRTPTTTQPHRKEITLMQNPISSCAGFRRGATRALRFIVAGTGAVLAGTGTALICTGVALKICGEKIKSFATNSARPEPRPMRRARVVPQPA
jgi:hypothetical protein